jgi:hypothetical protein
MAADYTGPRPGPSTAAKNFRFDAYKLQAASRPCWSNGRAVVRILTSCKLKVTNRPCWRWSRASTTIQDAARVGGGRGPEGAGLARERPATPAGRIPETCLSAYTNASGIPRGNLCRELRSLSRAGPAPTNTAQTSPLHPASRIPHPEPCIGRRKPPPAWPPARPVFFSTCNFQLANVRTAARPLLQHGRLAACSGQLGPRHPQLNRVRFEFDVRRQPAERVTVRLHRFQAGGGDGDFLGAQ